MSKTNNLNMPSQSNGDSGIFTSGSNVKIDNKGMTDDGIGTLTQVSVQMNTAVKKHTKAELLKIIEESKILLQSQMIMGSNVINVYDGSTNTVSYLV